MYRIRAAIAFGVLSVGCLPLAGCGHAPAAVSTSSTGTNPAAELVLSANASGGEGTLEPVRDPSVIHVNGTWYLFITDNPAWTGSLPMLCSQDVVSWKQCGSVFPALPAWIPAKLPGVVNLWAPDISYFNGEYHVYYTASLFGTENTLIGLATNTTLDATDPNYKWVDQGEVMESKTGDSINVLDPNVLVNSDGRVWLSYGSYWNGIAQSEIDPATGMVKVTTAQTALAARPGVANHPIEGSSQVFHDGYYYLFVSIDYCCNADLSTNDYKMAVGRSTSPNGPFVAEDGTPMMQDGATEILTGDMTHWAGVGGGTVYNDPASGQTEIVFHAQPMGGGGVAALWFKQIEWVNDWPVVD
jgi:arabinan endo-1,5-alpha-L-arabinosidase